MMRFDLLPEMSLTAFPTPKLVKRRDIPGLLGINVCHNFLSCREES
jgi:hypothetical protein